MLVLDEEAAARLGTLPPRKQELVGLLLHGYTDGEIAAKMGIEVTTISTHMTWIYDRLDVHTRMALAVWVLTGFQRAYNVAVD